MKEDQARGTLLIVEDDETLRAGLARTFLRQGYQVEIAVDGTVGMEKVLTCKPDLVLLDLNLPGMSGFEILREVRRLGNPVPVLILSARNRMEQRVEGLKEGADDYLAKPFELPELLARVEAMLRRQRRFVETEPPVRFGDVIVEPGARRVLRNGETVTLSTNELELLLLLLRNPGRTYERSAILTRVWGWQFEGTERTVDNFVSSLRRKLEVNPRAPKHLKTVRQIGYRFDP